MILIKINDRGTSACYGIVSVTNVLCLVYDSHVIVCHMAARRTRRALPLMTAGSCERARRATPPATLAIRCPCATPDRYSLNHASLFYMHSHADRRSARMSRRASCGTFIYNFSTQFLLICYDLRTYLTLRLIV